VLRVERTEAAVADGAADLVADLYPRLPEGPDHSRVRSVPRRPAKCQPIAGLVDKSRTG